MAKSGTYGLYVSSCKGKIWDLIAFMYPCVACEQVCEGEAVWRSQWLNRFGALWDNTLTQVGYQS